MFPKVKLNNQHLVKTVSSFCFILTSISLILISLFPAHGYELSIYSSTPIFVWLCLVGSIVGGIFIIVHQTFYDGNRTNNWIIGFSLLILNYFIILSLSALRGYFQYAGSDHMIHLQWSQNLIENFHIESDNFYPAIHVLVALISVISNIQPHVIMNYLAAFLSVLFLMLFNYILSKTLFLERDQAMLTAAASFIFLFNNLHTQIYPQTFSVFLFVPIFYLYIKQKENRSIQFTFLFIVFLILLPYTHPSSSIALLIVLTVAEIILWVFQKRADISSKSMKNASVRPILISLIAFFMWISSFSLFDIKLSTMLSSIFEPNNNLFLDLTVQTVDRMHLGEVLQYNFNMYSDSFIYIIVFFISTVIISKRYLEYEKNLDLLFTLALSSIFFIPIQLLLFFMIGSQSIGRALNLFYLTAIAPVYVGFLLHKLSKKNNAKKYIIYTTVFLILISGISIFSVYHSPWTFSASWHITNMDVDGSEWFLNHRNSQINFDAMGIDSSLIKGKNGLIPEHFNYSLNKDELGDSLSFDAYAIINKRCKLANAHSIISKIRLNIASGWGFSESDFKKLNDDLSVSKLYSNGEFDVFYVLCNE